MTLTDANNLTVTFGSSTSGRIVVAGGALDANIAGVKRYSESFISQTTGYIVTHGLNTLTPSVTVYNDSGEQIFPDITVTNANNVTIDFALSTSGDVEVQGGIQSTSPGSGPADFLPDTNNTWDIGSGTFKWKDSYFSGSITVNELNNSGSDITVSDDLDLGKNQAKQMVIETLATDPVSPVTGQVWFNTTDSQFKGYNGTSVVILG